MILGAVDADLEARVPLSVEDTSGQLHRTEAVIDTGFSEFLALPTSFIAALALVWLFEEQVILADGGIQGMDGYSVTINWHGQSRTVQVHAVDGDPLVGMKLLAGNEVRIRVVDGGLVLRQG